MNKDEQLARAIMIAANAHFGQYDKGGKPYILHPLHLMNELLYDKELAAIAVLHDVTEDSDVTLEDLKIEGFSNRVIAALRLLDHDKKDTYEDYIEKIAKNIDAITVKRKDLEHNSRITRLKGIEQKDFRRIEKYSKAFLFLGCARDKIKKQREVYLQYM